MKKSILLGLGIVLMVTQGFTQVVTIAAADVQNEFISSSDDNDYVKTKFFSKTYSVSKNSKLNLTNTYGRITIKTWDKNEVKAEVEMKVSSNREKDAIDLINGISILESQVSDAVSIKTQIEKTSRGFGNVFNNGKIISKRQLNVNYTIYMPSSMALAATMVYGDINILTFNGPTNFKVQYGNLNAEDLNSSNNIVSVQYGNVNLKNVTKATISQQYGKAVNILDVDDLTLTVQYAGADIANIKGKAMIKAQYANNIKIGTVEDLDLNAQYSSVNIGHVKQYAIIRQQYNVLNIGIINRLQLSSQYVSVNINDLKSDAVIKSTYNKVNVNKVYSSVKKLDVVTNYTSVSLGFDSAFSGDLDVTTRYTSLNSGRYRLSKISENSDTKVFQGQIGNGGTSSVSIKAEYGSLTLK